MTGVKNYCEGVIDDPASVEHFGISIVEAMSRGAIPVVTAAGGPSEIVIHNVTGYHAHSPRDFIVGSHRDRRRR